MKVIPSPSPVTLLQEFSTGDAYTLSAITGNTQFLTSEGSAVKMTVEPLGNTRPTRITIIKWNGKPLPG